MKKVYRFLVLALVCAAFLIPAPAMAQEAVVVGDQSCYLVNWPDTQKIGNWLVSPDRPSAEQNVWQTDRDGGIYDGFLIIPEEALREFATFQIILDVRNDAVGLARKLEVNIRDENWKEFPMFSPVLSTSNLYAGEWNTLLSERISVHNARSLVFRTLEGTDQISFDQFILRVCAAEMAGDRQVFLPIAMGR